jgi:hypothetical protein
MLTSKLRLADAAIQQSQSPVRRCYLGKLYYLGARRANGYGPTALFVFGSIDPLHLTLSDAAEFIEPLRRQGRFWEAIDVPAVVLESDEPTKLIIVGEGYGHDTLQRLVPSLPEERHFGALAKTLMTNLPKEVWAIETEENVSVATFPFGRNRGVRLNTGELFWAPEWWFNDAQSAVRIVSTICLWLAEGRQSGWSS